MAENKNKTDDKTTEKSVDNKPSSENITQENVVENNIELIAFLETMVKERQIY